MLFFQENKEIPNKNTEEYCQKLEELLNFYNQTKTKFSLDPKREEVFSNLNLLYSKYFEFQIIKEYYSSCKKWFPKVFSFVIVAYKNLSPVLCLFK